jgi:hypothetical protein
VVWIRWLGVYVGFMFGCGVRGCAGAFAVAVVCCVCLVTERSFCGAFGMPENSLHCVNGG